MFVAGCQFLDSQAVQAVQWRTPLGANCQRQVTVAPSQWPTLKLPCQSRGQIWGHRNIEPAREHFVQSAVRCFFGDNFTSNLLELTKLDLMVQFYFKLGADGPTSPGVDQASLGPR